MAGSSFGDTILNIYQDGGFGIGGLSFLQCAYYGNSATFSVQAGVTYYLQAGSINSGGGDLHVNLRKFHDRRMTISRMQHPPVHCLLR